MIHGPSNKPSGSGRMRARVIAVGAANRQLTHLVLATSSPPGPFSPFQYFLCGPDEDSLRAAPACGYPGSDRMELVLPAGSHAWSPCEGEAVLVRGPFGTGVGLGELYGRDLLVVAEGSALAPVRALLQAMDRERSRFGFVRVLAGAATPEDLPCRGHLDLPRLQSRLDVRLTVERPDAAWDGEKGVVPVLFRGLRIDPIATIVVVAGPRPLFKMATLEVLMRGVSEGAVFVLPERGHRCTPRTCRYCAEGSLFTCAEGPVFPYPLLKDIPERYV